MTWEKCGQNPKDTHRKYSFFAADTYSGDLKRSQPNSDPVGRVKHVRKPIADTPKEAEGLLARLRHAEEVVRESLEERPFGGK